jgi:hypothetical protein
VAEKLWHTQRPGCIRLRMSIPFRATHAFSLLALTRCEIQAIDQHWSLHRIVVSLPDGLSNPSLARELDFAQLDPRAGAVDWPRLAPDQLAALLRPMIELELTGELAAIRLRQENYLRRELERIDAYFENYQRELGARLHRASESAKTKAADRLAAAKAEHARRHADQLKRHEIRVIPHFDTLLLLAEPAWGATVDWQNRAGPQTAEACFIPRSRSWRILSERG